ncbi:MAG TPA: hypothetical protein VLO30_05925 [Chthoniobacterales bacterium]|nr:hypothetical protein [Chthoniobacterales bacterium]
MKTLQVALAPGASAVALGLFAALLWASGNGTAYGADAALTAGNPVNVGTPSQFSGVGGTNTNGGAFTALSAFEAAIGGVKNIAPSPQTGGFRVITWDGVAVDGTDFGGNTKVIVPNKIVGIPLNRFEAQGVFFEEVYAVSNDGFKSVNANVNAANPQLFPAFSPAKTFVMFNDNGIGFSFVLASAGNVSPQPAASRGFGAIFLNSRSANTTSIEYFNGVRSLGKFFVPTGAQGAPEFLGVLFATPIVTSVQITCGTEAIFTFDGVTAAGSTTDNPAGGHNLVATDDFVYAEPVAATNAQPILNPTAGSMFNGTVATFSDLDLSGVAGNFTATIDWGDGHTSPGVISSNANGGFNVAGGNTYAGGGRFPVTIEIADFLGSKLTINNTAAVTGTGQVLNISTRARVDTGDNVLFGGFIIGSATNTSKVIVRALGPSLTAFGVPGALADPTLELHDGNGVTIATNDNWKVNDLGGSQQAEVEATTIPPANDFESALVRTLAPGGYTAIVRGKNNGTGVALVEVYNLLQ